LLIAQAKQHLLFDSSSCHSSIIVAIRIQAVAADHACSFAAYSIAEDWRSSVVVEERLVLNDGVFAVFQKQETILEISSLELRSITSFK
jgi:hypothetical protein